MPISAPDLIKYGWLYKGYQCYHMMEMWSFFNYQEKKRKEKNRKEKKRKEKKRKEKKRKEPVQVDGLSAPEAWLQWFSSQLSPVLHFPPHRPGAQDKSQQAQMLATCQMLLGLWLPALSIWLATLAGSHLLLTQHFLFKNVSYQLNWSGSHKFMFCLCRLERYYPWLGCQSWIREVWFVVSTGF